MTLDDKIADAERIVRLALDVHLGDRELVGRVVLFSGGNDSTVLAHLARHVFPDDLRATAAGHANTTIGVEATRQFVRDTCASWGLPLLEKLPPTTYAELVREGGFPGAAMHFRQYQRLKERGLRQIRAELVTNGRRQRVLFLAGRRRAESARRVNVPEHERDGAIVWGSPLAHWTAADMAAYRERYPEVPRNRISEALGMSGECLCGAFAEPGELDRIKAVDPEVYEQIRALEAEVHGKFAEHRCHWGWHGWHDERRQPSKTGPLCSSCDARGGALAERLPPDTSLDAVIARGRARRAARLGIAADPLTTDETEGAA